MSGDAAGILPDTKTQRGRGRPRGSCGPVREAIGRLIASGITGSMDALAAHTGWPPEHVRRAVKEMRRARDLDLIDTQAVPGQHGPPAGIYGQAQPKTQIDALAFVSQVWR